MTRRRSTMVDDLYSDVLCWLHDLRTHFESCDTCASARQWRSFCRSARRMLSFAAWRATQ